MSLADASPRSRQHERLRVSVGQHSDKGTKPRNQDFHGLCVPKAAQLDSKGIAVALADGISSSEVSHIASETAVAAFLNDYYSTSDAWSVKTSALRVLAATNAWLHAQSRRSPHRYDLDRGYVCTFSALVLKSTTAHLFHIGDARIYRLRDAVLEPLTQEHRLHIDADRSYLSRALGMQAHLEVDYQALPMEVGDLFLLATDGVHAFVDDRSLRACIDASANDLQHAAQLIVERALAGGSDDNLTVQLLRIEQLPDGDPGELQQRLDELPCPPMLEAPCEFDGYRILRKLHASARSHLYLARDPASEALLVIKTPSQDLQHDPRYLQRLLLEEWIARRVDNPHVLKAHTTSRRRHYLYNCSEFIDGQTLAQWQLDHPQPSLQVVRDMVGQIARGLRALHRLEMLHQDLRPANLMIDTDGIVKIIDFGATHVAGLQESDDHEAVLGTAQYSAPEYWLGQPATVGSDLFSLAVITYQLLSGRLPYGAAMARARSRTAQMRLRYQPLARQDLPPWLDDVLRKGCHPDPNKRYQDPDEFAHALRHPGQALLQRRHRPLLERNPLMFWQLCSLSLALALLLVLLR